MLPLSTPRAISNPLSSLIIFHQSSCTHGIITLHTPRTYSHPLIQSHTHISHSLNHPKPPSNRVPFPKPHASDPLSHFAQEKAKGGNGNSSLGLYYEPYVSLTIGNDAVEDEICLHSFGIILSSFSCTV